MSDVDDASEAAARANQTAWRGGYAAQAQFLSESVGASLDAGSLALTEGSVVTLEIANASAGNRFPPASNASVVEIFLGGSAVPSIVSADGRFISFLTPPYSRICNDSNWHSL